MTELQTGGHSELQIGGHSDDKNFFQMLLTNVPPGDPSFPSETMRFAWGSEPGKRLEAGQESPFRCPRLPGESVTNSRDSNDPGWQEQGPKPRLLTR